MIDQEAVFCAARIAHAIDPEGWSRVFLRHAPGSTVRYVCGGCGMHGAKLWRGINGGGIQGPDGRTADLLCRTCIEAWRPDRIRPGDDDDQLGDLLPAVPVGDTFWGYTSVPDAGCAWWNSLPDIGSTVTTLGAAQAEWVDLGGDPERGPVLSWAGNRVGFRHTKWSVDVIGRGSVLGARLLVRIAVGDVAATHQGGTHDEWWMGGIGRDGDIIELGRLVKAADRGTRWR